MAVPAVINVVASTPKAIDVVFSEGVKQDETFFDPASYVVTPELAGVNEIAISSVDSDTARLVLPVQLREGLEYTLDVVGEIFSLSTNDPLDPNKASGSFIGKANLPDILSAVALNKDFIRLTFTEPMDIMSISLASAFQARSHATGKIVPLKGVTPIENIGYVTQADLSVANKMTNGGLHTVTMDGAIDLVGNRQKTGASSEFTGIADLPQLLSAEIDAITKELVITFDSVMSAFAATYNAYSFSHPVSAASVGLSGLTLSADRRSVRVKIAETLNGAIYTVTANPSVFDDFGNPIKAGAESDTFTGVGSIPTLIRAETLSANRIDLVFSEPIFDNGTARDVATYAVDNGLVILAVLGVAQERVKLVTSTQNPGALYTFLIS